MIVTIDGPAGSGKSSVARLLAEREDFVLLNTGAMYRAMTVAMLKDKVALDDAAAIAQKAASVHVDYVPKEGGAQLLVDEKDVSGELWGDGVDAAVSVVAAVSEVREIMVGLQRQVAQGRNVVAEGRDLGTVVFPHAQVKIYLSADLKTRARRRALQKAAEAAPGTGAAALSAAQLKAMEQELAERDKRDSSRALAPLAQASDAVLVDTSALTLTETVSILDVLVQSRRQGFTAMSDLALPQDIPQPPTQRFITPPAKKASPNQKTSQEKKSTEPVLQELQGVVAPIFKRQESQAQSAKGEPLDPKRAQKPKDAQKGVCAAAHPSLPSASALPRGSSSFYGDKERTPFDQTLKPMRPFHNSFDDYFDHGIMDFPWTSRVFYSIIGAGVYCVTKLFWPWSFEGEEEFFAWLKTQERGTVMIMNHVSLIETPLPSVIFWLHGMRIRPLYKDEINKILPFKWALSRVGGIPVGRGTPDIKALRRAQHALERGESVLVFPEGTRIQTDEQPVVAHGGFALIARMGKTTVTPSAVIGARKVPHHKKALFHRRHVFLKIGAPVTFGMIGIKGRKARLEAMEALAMERVYELRAQLRLEHPGEE